VQEEELIKNLKYVQDHMIAVTEYVFLQIVSTESQGSAIANIFQYLREEARGGVDQRRAPPGASTPVRGASDTVARTEQWRHRTHNHSTVFNVSDSGAVRNPFMFIYIYICLRYIVIAATSWHW